MPSLADEAVSLHGGVAWNRVIADEADPPLQVVRADRGASPETTGATVPFVTYRHGPPNDALHPANLFEWRAGGRDRRLWEPVTVVGGRTGMVEIPAAADRAAWAATACATATAADRGATVFLPIVDSRLVIPLVEPGGSAVPLLGAPATTMIVPGGAAGSVESGLRPRQRELARAEQRRLARGGRTVEREPLTARNIADLAALQARTQGRHRAFGDTAHFTRLYERIAASDFAADAHAFVCRVAGEAIACSVAVRHATTLVVLGVGLDYDRVGEFAEYPSVLVHAPVRFAAAQGLRAVDLGLGGYTTKIVRGAVPRLTWSVVLRGPGVLDPAAAAYHNRVRALSVGRLRDRLSTAEQRVVAAAARTGDVLAALRAAA